VLPEDGYSNIFFFTESTPRNFQHTIRFYTTSNGSREIANYIAAQGDDRAPAAQILLALAKGLNDIFAPIYTTIDFQYKQDPQSLKKTLRVRRIQELYWANIFDKGYVGIYGKGFFENAPVWKTEELANGGYLVQLNPEIAPASKKAIDVENIAKYFQPAGLKYIGWPTNKFFKRPKM
jgi:hypothetical protein